MRSRRKVAKSLFARGGGTCPQQLHWEKAEFAGQIPGTHADAELPTGSDSAWLPHPLQPALCPGLLPPGAL